MRDTTFIPMGVPELGRVKRTGSDFYSTDPKAITLLDKQGLLDDKPYWECACGNGNLAEELKELGYTVSKTTDLYEYDYGESGIDFLEQTEKFDGNIITNPPYNQLLEFILKGLELSENKLYIFARIQTLETVKRWKLIFKEYKPIYVCPFVRRISCFPENEGKRYDSAICYAWFIWDVNNLDSEPKIRWLI